MFARLCDSLNFDPAFLEIVSTFGYRGEDSDNYFSASLWRTMPCSAVEDNYHAFRKSANLSEYQSS